LNWCRLSRLRINETRFQTVFIVAGVLITAAGVVLTYLAMPESDKPRPEPAETRVDLYTNPPTAYRGWYLAISWQTRGNRPTRCLFVTVYGADERGARQSKLAARLVGEDRCAAVSPSAIPFTSLPLAVSGLPDNFLICAAYVDESGKKYRQAFRYRVLPPVVGAGGAVTSVRLDEEFPRPDERTSKKICR
jgi:hypothetical protein